MERVVGVVQHYAWGDPSFIPDLLGARPDGTPWAELWLGTHPSAPSTAIAPTTDTGSSGHADDDHRPLADISGTLPYLLKVLAAAEPLSLQTHPTAQQAQLGFEREERDGPAIDAADRIYRDPYPKPELICALTSFDALCGFRPVVETVALLRSIGAGELADRLERDGLAASVTALYRNDESMQATISATIAACAKRPEPEARLVVDLASHYPDEPSVAVTLLLNRLTLEPGEAIFLGPGNLHAYVHGVGIEIMGASDNVVRGGLTVKHVDVDELLAVLDFTPLVDPRTPSSAHGPGNWCYDTPGTPFRLWRHEIDDSFSVTASGRELLLCTDGATDLLTRGQTVYLAPGESISLNGSATVFRVEERN